MRKLLSLFLIVSILCSFSTAYAAFPVKKFPYWQNWGGLNDQLSETEIADNEATDIQNIIFDAGGAIKKRFGFLTIPNDDVEKAATGAIVCINGLAFFRQDDGSRYVVAITNNDSKATAMKKDYEIGGGLEAGSWESIEFDGMPANFTNSDLADFSVAEDKLIATISATSQVKPFAWDGGDNFLFLTGDTDCPVATLNEYHKNHLFLAGNDSFPSRVNFSNLDDITGYEPLDFFDVQTSDGSRVRGFISAYGSLYILKDYSIWRLSGYERDTFRLEKMVSGIGTLSQQSIKIVNNLIYFTTAKNDIAVYDGAYNVVFISQKIRNTIGGLNFSRATNTLGLAFSTYKYNDYDYYTAVSNAGSSENNRVLLFDTAFKAWTKFKGINANAWVVAEDSAGQDIMLFGDYDGYVHSYPSTTYYDGNVSTSAINALYQTKWFRYSDISLGDKYWRVLKTYTLTENTDTFLYVEAKSDFELSGKILTLNLSQSGDLWDIMLWDVGFWAGQSLLAHRSEIEKGKDMFQARFYNNAVNEGFTIFGYDMFIEPTERD